MFLIWSRLMVTLLDENEIVMLDQILNIVENMLFLTFTLNLTLWWREVAKIRDGVGVDGGGWFKQCIETMVRNGVDTFFLDIPVVRRSSFVFAVSATI